ncbi:MAG: phosphatase PAP2 family protein [Syntrophobacter sp.]
MTGPENRPSEKSMELPVCLSILLVLTLVFRFTDLDVGLQRLFYSPEEGWKYAPSFFCTLIYNYGAWPGLVLTGVAAVVLCAGYLRPDFASFRKSALFIVLLAALGPGLVVNGILKAQSGRPRPRDVAVFSGSHEFQRVGDKGEAGEGYSFPSGHASMGFFLGAPYFLVRRSNRGWAISWLALGLTSGVVIGIGRMAQGGHFASDVLWAWGVVHISGLALAYLLRMDSGGSAS